MKTAQVPSYKLTSSAPSGFDDSTGAGSLIATIFSKGVSVSRHTQQGSIKPFGQDTGTADDSTAIVIGGATSPTADS